MRGGRVVAAAVGTIGVLVMAPAASATTVFPACTGIQTDLNSAGAGDVIQLPAGSCSVNLTVNSDTAAFTLQGAPGGSTLVPLSTAVPIISSNAPVRLTISGVTFSGATAQPDVLLEDPGEAVTFTRDTFTGNSYPGGFGAAISIQTQFKLGTLATQPTVISQSTFDHNTAADGAAIALLGSNPITVSGNSFTSNAVQEQGGAVDIGGAATPSTSPIVLIANQFGGAAGGSGNTAVNEGGAVALTPGKGEPVSVNDNTFENNAVTGSAQYDREGGALYLFGASDPGVSVNQAHNVFSSNRIDAGQLNPTPARIAGGAAEFVLAGSITSFRDTFTGNRVSTHDGIEPWGGAVGAFADNGSTKLPGVFVGTDDLFSDNSTAAGGWGGAIYVGGPPAACSGSCPPSSLTLNDSTVFSNRVDAGPGSEGGAIWGSSQDHLTIRNSIVYGNSPTTEIFGFGTGSPSIQYSDVCSGAGGPTAPASAHDICADPRLDASGVEGSLSPTLDAGSNALVPAGTTTDLAGNARIRENRSACFTTPPAIVDMGAFEFTGHPPVLPCPAPISSVLIGPGPLHVARGRTAVTLTCRGFGAFCQGTVTLTTAKRFRARDPRARKRKPHQLTLGQATYRMNRDHRTTVSIRLSRSAISRLHNASTIRVIVGVRNHTSEGVLALDATRTVTLVLTASHHRRR